MLSWTVCLLILLISIVFLLICFVTFYEILLDNIEQSFDLAYNFYARYFSCYIQLCLFLFHLSNSICFALLSIRVSVYWSIGWWFEIVFLSSRNFHFWFMFLTLHMSCVFLWGEIYLFWFTVRIWLNIWWSFCTYVFQLPCGGNHGNGYCSKWFKISLKLTIICLFRFAIRKTISESFDNGLIFGEAWNRFILMKHFNNSEYS